MRDLNLTRTPIIKKNGGAENRLQDEASSTRLIAFAVVPAR
jgi:hypothetical protein